MTGVAGSSHATRTGLLAASLLTLAGCGLVPVEENTFQSGPLPAISADGVDRVLADVDLAMTAANTARDPELLAEVTAGPLLDIDSKRYALDSLADPDDTDTATPVAHRDPTAFIPRFEGYPQWFVVAATSEPDGPLRLEVLTRGDAGAPWLALIAPELLPDVEFPVLALDDAGYVVPLASSDLGDLPIGAEELAAANADALSGVSDGSADGLAAELAADPWTAARLQADAAAAAAVGAAATVTSAYEAGTVLDQALRTEDGGAVVFYALTGDREYAVTATYFLELDATTAAIVGTPEVTATLVESWAAQLAVYIPPDDDGAPRVVAARWDRVGLSGS